MNSQGKFRAYLRGVAVVAGALLIAVGLLITTNNFGRLASYFPKSGIGVAEPSRTPSALAAPVSEGSSDHAALAPDLHLKDINGRDISLASLRGKVVIVDFWATWCPPCRMEVPTFKQLQTKYQNKGLEIVAIALDNDENDVKQFARKHQLSYTVAHGNEEIISKFEDITGIPTTFFIDRAGRIRKRHIGYMDQSEFEQEIQELLSESQSKPK